MKINRLLRLLLFALGFSTYTAVAQSNVWEKEISDTRRLVVSKVPLSKAAFAERLSTLRAKHQVVEETLPTSCYTYRLDLYEIGKARAKCLWQNDYFQYDRTPLANYTGPLERQIIDACYNESNNIVIILMKSFGYTYAEICVPRSDQIKIISNGDDNMLPNDDHFGLWRTKTGSIDCSDPAGFRIRLISEANKIALFSWKNGKWLRQPEGEH